MKTLFQSGFAAQRRFWMGISSINSTALDLEMDTYAKVQGWLATTPNPSDVLGSDYASFQTANTEIRGLYDDVVAIADKARANQDLNDDEVTKANAFIRDAEYLWAAIQAHPPLPSTTTPATITPTPKPAVTAPSTTNPAQAITSAAGQIAKTLTTPPPAAAAPAAPAPAAAKTDYTPLLIGGGIVGALLLVLVATK